MRYTGAMTASRSFFSALLVALALIASACGGSDGGDTASDATTTTTTEAPTTTVEETTTTTEAPTTTVEKATTTTTTTVVEEVVTDASDPVVVAYCEASALADERTEQVDFFDPDALREFFPIQLAALEEVEPPAAIADDVAITIEGFRKYPEIFERNDWDFAASVDDLEAEVATPEWEAASDNMDAFEDEFCPNIEPSLDAPDDDGADTAPGGITVEDIEGFLSTPEGRGAIAQGMASTSALTEEQALCFVENTDAETIFNLFQIGAGGSTENAGDALAGLEVGLEACGLSIGQFSG